MYQKSTHKSTLQSTSTVQFKKLFSHSLSSSLDFRRKKCENSKMSNNLDENPFGEPFDDPFKVKVCLKLSSLAHRVKTYWFFRSPYRNILKLMNHFFSSFLRYLFQDVSIQQVAESTSKNNQNLDNYDPFSSPTLPVAPSQTHSSSSFPTSSQTTENPNQPHQQINTAELQVRFAHFEWNFDHWAR